MLAGIGHDLRTPLTRMKLQIALLNDKEAIKNAAIVKALMNNDEAINAIGEAVSTTSIKVEGKQKIFHFHIYR